MHPHAPKCWLGLHDWQHTTERSGEVVVVEKACQWCDETTVETVTEPTERDERVLFWQ